MLAKQYSHDARDAYHDVMIGVQTRDGSQWHLAVFYKHFTGETYMFHLLWHHVFKNESAAKSGDQYYVMPIGETSPYNLEIMCAAFSILDWHNAPYGLSIEGHILDSRQQFVSAPLGRGFTCATAVLAIFRSLGFNLIEPIDWPERHSDDAWQNWVIEALTEHNKTRSVTDLDMHIAEMKRDVGAKRIRPTEMAAAANIFDLPTEFLACSETSARIEREVRQLMGV